MKARLTYYKFYGSVTSILDLSCSLQHNEGKMTTTMADFIENSKERSLVLDELY